MREKKHMIGEKGRRKGRSRLLPEHGSQAWGVESGAQDLIPGLWDHDLSCLTV